MSIVERAIKKLQESHPRTETDRSATTTDEPMTVTANVRPQVQPAHADALSSPDHSARKVTPFDLDRLRLHRLMPPVEQERELAAQYRQIKRSLVARGLGRGQARVPRGNALILVSALPGEGKSFTALNLALSMALEQDVQVLLVDADVARPRLTQEFGLESEAGLLDAVRDGRVDVESLVVGTDVPSLSLLPAGTLGGTATELLASPRMDAMVESLCSRHANRIIVFDAPPVLPTTEARVLAQAMGQVVVVVRAGFTPQEAVFATLRLIGDRDHVSLVLTQAQAESAGSYYYSNYGYGAYGEAGS